MRTSKHVVGSKWIRGDRGARAHARQVKRVKARADRRVARQECGMATRAHRPASGPIGVGHRVIVTHMGERTPGVVIREGWGWNGQWLEVRLDIRPWYYAGEDLVFYPEHLTRDSDQS